MDPASATTAIRPRRRLLALACGLALLGAALSSTVRAQTVSLVQPVDAATPPDAATLLQCQTTGEAAERAATFSGEMTTLPGAVRMSMRVDLLERAEGESRFHAVSAPGLGVWRTADPGVAVFKYVKQVTNLSAPAAYRALFTFRWQGPRGRPLRREEKRTRRCAQPAPASGSSSAPGSPAANAPQPPSSPPAVE